jgi:hypothetical protein
MFRALAVVVLGLLTSSCAAPLYGPYAPRYGDPYRLGAARAIPVPTPLPTGRWDNVMMLRPGTPLQVLTLEAGLTEGRLIGATASRLRLETPGGSVDLPAIDVVRVDRLPETDSVREGLRGAATGVGAMGVLGLLVGRMPPARMFAAGAITGAYSGVQMHLAAPSRATVYLADRAVVPVPAPSR